MALEQYCAVVCVDDDDRRCHCRLDERVAATSNDVDPLLVRPVE